MARIRTIKPEFFTSEDIVSLSPLARLFYIGLWCEADREGKLTWKPFTLKLRYLPADQVDINDIAGELINSGLLFTYEVDNDSYAIIPKFLKHQVINMKEAQSKIPFPNSHKFTGIHMNSPEFTEKLTGKGKERKGNGKEGNGIYFPADKKIIDTEVVDVIRSVEESLLTEEQKELRLQAISQELYNSHSWQLAVASAIGKTASEVEQLIGDFIKIIRADGEYFKPLKQVQIHFRNWAKRNGNTPKSTKASPVKQAVSIYESLVEDLNNEYPEHGTE